MKDRVIDSRLVVDEALESTDADFIIRVSKDSSKEYMWYSLCFNPNTPPEVLFNIATSDVWFGSKALNHPSLPGGTLERIIFGGYSDTVKSRALIDSRTPEEIILKFMKDFPSAYRVVLSVFNNPNVTVKSVKLAFDNFGKDIDRHSLKDLAKTTKDKELMQFLVDNNLAVDDVASNRSISTKLLEEIFKKYPSNLRVLCEIAKNPRCNTKTLERLASLNNPALNLPIARHRNSKESILFSISSSKDEITLLRLMENKNCSMGLLRSIAENGFSETIKSSAEAKIQRVLAKKRLSEEAG